MKENKQTNKSNVQEYEVVSRRNFITKTLFVGAGLAAGSLSLAASQNQASAQTRKRNNTKVAANPLLRRRRLGTLEVSAVGLGVQNMSRKYETTVPYRPEMINIIRAAFDRGVTFFDAAEAYGLALVALVKSWAKRKQSTPAQIALSWLLAQKPWIVPIPGTTQMAHMMENSGADGVRFTPAELAELNSAVRTIEIRGQRLPDAVLVFSGVEAPQKK